VMEKILVREMGFEPTHD